MVANANSGRKKGTPNKDKQALAVRLAIRHPEYNPVMAMAANAVAMQADVDAVAESLSDPDSDAKVDLAKLNQMRALVNQEHNAVAQYLHPKLKAIENTGSTLHRVKVIDLTGQKKGK